MPWSCMQAGALLHAQKPAEAFSAGLGRLQGQQAKRRSAAVASATDGGGYNSDEEVYAVARAIDAEDEVWPLSSWPQCFENFSKDGKRELR